MTLSSVYAGVIAGELVRPGRATRALSIPNG